MLHFIQFENVKKNLQKSPMFISILFKNHVVFIFSLHLVTSPTRVNRTKFDVDKPNDSSSSDQVRFV